MFDLKGIQGRKVKTKARGSKTLFDNEWIEGECPVLQTWWEYVSNRLVICRSTASVVVATVAFEECSEGSDT